MALSAEDDARRSELAARHGEIAEAHNGSGDDLPDDSAAELDRIEAELAELKTLLVGDLREGAGERAAGQIAGSKKEILGADAEQLLAGAGWLPSVPRVSEPTYPVDSGDTDSLTTPPMLMAAE